MKREVAIKFRNEARTVTMLFSRELKTTRLDSCKRVVIRCVSEITDDRIIRGKDGIYAVQSVMNVEEYFNLSEIERKEKILETIHGVIQRMACEDGWDITNFMEAYNSVKSLNFVNQWMWKKRPVYSSNKKYKANILCSIDFNGFMLTLQVFDKKNVLIFEKKIYNQNPLNPVSYLDQLNILEWVSDTELVLTSKDMKDWVYEDNKLIIMSKNKREKIPIDVSEAIQ